MRALVAFTLLLVGALMVPVATAGWWLRDTVVPQAAYVDTVAPLADDVHVQDAVANTLVEETMTSLEDLPDAVAERLQPLVRKAADLVVASPAFAEAWRKSNRAAHRQLVGALAGESASVRADDGSTVELRLGPLVAAVRNQIDTSGIPIGLAVPQTDTTYPIGDTEDLARAKTAYNLLHDYGRALPVVTGVLLLLGLALARQRGPALTLASVVALVGLGLLWLGIAFGRSTYLDNLPAAVPEAAGRAYYDILTAGLEQSVLYVAAGAAVAAVVGVVASLVTTRRH
jgi:hypothetical protein